MHLGKIKKSLRAVSKLYLKLKTWHGSIRQVRLFEGAIKILVQKHHFVMLSQVMLEEIQ